MIIGIDLGTTNSVVAWMNGDRPELIPNALGDFLTPSVVGIDTEGDLLVGRTAKEHQVVYPERCASLFKRHMGSDWSTKICGRKFTPEQLSGLILRSLKEDAESHLGQTITRAVISVPAYFNDPQRKATIRAAQIAELEVDRILNEPTAASIAYGLHDSDDEKVIAVFDLGGGTFDVSIVELFDGTVEVRSSAGESFLGGEDFTRAMVAQILQSQGRQFERVELETPALVSRLIQQCERAKCQLTASESVQILLPDDNGEMSENPNRETITRAQFQDWTERVLSRVELPIRRALSDAKLKRADIDEVILVGGATRMPAVIDRVATWFDKTPHSRLDPDHVVALGAAVQAGLIEKNQSLDDLVVTDVAPFTLGINISKDFGTERRSGYFMPIVHRNTTIPVSRVDRVSTADANQTEILVEIYQGESRMVKDNLLLGELRLTGIPSGPAGQEVDVRFTYDLNGVLEVEATIVKTKKKVQIVITKHTGGMSQRQIARAVEQMQSLKTHLREETVNRFLTKRAERIYRELPPTDRWQLSELLDGFETALEAREPQVIDEFRQTLEAFLDRFEQGLSDGWGENDDPS